MVSEPIYQAMVRQSAKIGIFGHGFTYGGHPVAAAAALEAIRIYEERDIVGHVRRVGPRLQEGLGRFSDHPLVGEVRGVGLVAGMELVRDKESKESFDPSLGVPQFMMDRAREHGLITRALGDTLAFSPPLIISEDEIDELLGCVARALDDTQAMARDLS